MARHLSRIALGLGISAILAAPLVAAGEASQQNPSPEDLVPLHDADLRAITLQVMESNPILASSPGIKFALARRSFRITSPQGIAGTTDSADIIFYPHAESAGIKQAFQVQCQRQNPSELWICGDARLRRYVQLEAQEFELRVVDDIPIEVVQALVQSTRTTAQAAAARGTEMPEAAIIVLPMNNDEYLVDWGNDHGHHSVSVQAKLRKDGNPAVPEDWQTEIFKPEE